MGSLVATENLFLWTAGWLFLLFSLLSSLIVILYIKVVHTKKEVFTLKNKLVSAQYEIDELTQEKEEKQKFTDSLTSAKVTTKLQEPRLQIKNQGIPDTPEKYRYLATMARSGMSIQEISKILDISCEEADQLVTLARIAE